MLEFQKITRGSKKELAELFSHQPWRACDYTFGANYQWRYFYQSTYAVCDNMAIMRAAYPGLGCCYLMPAGTGDMKTALQAIDDDATERGRWLRVFAPTEQSVDLLREHFGDRIVSAVSVRSLADYLYETERLITFAGKKMHGQKNHRNRFYRENPEARFVPVTEETLPQAEAFLKEYEQEIELEQAIEVEELHRAQELLHHAFELGQLAGFIETEQGIAALSIGEVIGDTLYVHVEKARTRFHGAYQAIVSAFAEYAVTVSGGAMYCNREDDSGDDGLRHSKLAYHPIELIEKYWVIIDPPKGCSKKIRKPC